MSAVLLTSIVFSLGGFINAIFAKNFDQISLDPDVRADATHLSRRRVLLDLAAARWAQGVSHANPILYMVNAFRYGFLGVSDVDVRLAYTIMIGAAVVLFTSCVWLLTRGVGTRE